MSAQNKIVANAKDLTLDIKVPPIGIKIPVGPRDFILPTADLPWEISSSLK
jgi:hypothetical protein